MKFTKPQAPKKPAQVPVREVKARVATVQAKEEVTPPRRKACGGWTT